mgnify:CR=1 FL=1
MKLSKWGFAAAALLLPAGVAQAQAQAPTADTQSVTAVELFGLADAAMRDGRVDEAETIYRALIGDPEIELRTEARFRLAQLLRSQGEKRAAAVLFREILDEKPDAPRVRIELAGILAELGDLTAARRQLRQVQSGALPPHIARAVDQFSTALRSRRPYGASFEVAIAPDSNINRATEVRTLDTVIAPLELDRDARSRSGIGIKLAGQSFARVPLGSRSSLVPRLSGIGDLYRSSQFNDLALSAQLGVEHSFGGRDRVTISLGEGWRYFGGDLYARTHAVSGDWLHAIGQTMQLSVALSAARANHRNNDLQDGTLFDANIGYEQAFHPRSGGSLSIGLTRQTARDPGYAHVSGSVTSLYYHEVGGASLFGSASLRRLEADERVFLFPQRRRDWLGRMTVGGTFRQLKLSGFAPVVRIIMERNHSTVGIYDYRRKAVEFGVTRAF